MNKLYNLAVIKRCGERMVKVANSDQWLEAMAEDIRKQVGDMSGMSV